MKRQFVLGFCIALLTFASACQPQPPQTPANTSAATAPDTRAADESALRELDVQWSNAAGAKDVDKTVSYYADDAVVLPPNGPTATTKAAVRKIWSDMMATPGYAMSWKVNKVEVARSGDLAVVSGTYEFKMNDASGKPMTDRGKYVEVMKKQADGTWKCVNDIWNSDIPMPASHEMK